MKLALIFNPRAGGGRTGRALADVERTLARLGLAYRAERTLHLDHARELTRAAAAAGEVAVAFGGDGLVGAVAGELHQSQGVLGVLPGGRGNDFARVLGIPLDPSAACEVLATGVLRPLDLGQAGSRTFVGIASCGFDSVVNRIANEARLVPGSLVYTYGALRALVGFKTATFSVELDGGERRVVTGYFVAVANSKAYGGGMMMAPDASLNDGLLDVVIVGQASKLRLLRLLPTVYAGKHVGQPFVEILRSRSVRVSASRPFTVYADGDPFAELPVTFTVLPGAVRALVPADR